MLDLREVFPLTDFLRNHKEHVARLTQTGKPMVITVKGKPALVLQSAESYKGLLDLIDSNSKGTQGEMKLKDLNPTVRLVGANEF